jgi:hypothetical protein
MSTMALVQGPNGVFAAWETDGQIYFAGRNPGTSTIAKPQAAPGDGRDRKHPALAINARGEMLLAWTEGTGWEKGGALAWQVFDKNGEPTSARGRVEAGIPVWGLPTAVATDGGFTIVH